MPLYPGIGLDFQPNQSLQNFPQQAISLQMLGQQQRKQQQVMALNQTPGMVESGLYTDQGLIALSQIDPAMRDAAVQKRAQVLELQSIERKRQADEDRERQKERIEEFNGEAIIPALGVYHSGNGSEENRRQAFSAKLNEVMDSWKANGKAKKFGLKDEDMQRIRSMSPDDAMAKLLSISKDSKTAAAYFMEKEVDEKMAAKKAKESSPEKGVSLADVAKVDPETGAITKPMEQKPGEGTPLAGPNPLLTAEGLPPSGEPERIDPDPGNLTGKPRLGGPGEDDVIAPTVNQEESVSDEFRQKALAKEKEAADYRDIGGTIANKRADAAEKEAQQYWRRAQAGDRNVQGEDRIKLAREREQRLAEKQAQALSQKTTPRESKLSRTAIETAAVENLLTGKLPSNIARSYKGEMGPEARDIINEAAELQKFYGLTGGEVAMMRANNKAMAPALAQMQKQKNAIEGFERTLQYNVDEAVKISDQILRKDSTLANIGLEQIYEQGLGGKEVQDLVARLYVRNEAIAAEVGKIMSGSMENAQLAQSAQEHARKLLNTRMPGHVYRAAAGEIIDETKQGRVKGLRQQVDQMLKQMTTPNMKEADMPEASGVTELEKGGKNAAGIPEVKGTNPKSGWKIEKVQ